MLPGKCCIPDCDITSSSLLITVIDKHRVHKVCPKHVTTFIEKLINDEALDSYINETLFDHTCSFCSRKATHHIHKEKPYPKSTFLCSQHVQELVADIKNQNISSPIISTIFCSYNKKI